MQVWVGNVFTNMVIMLCEQDGRFGKMVFLFFYICFLGWC